MSMTETELASGRVVAIAGPVIDVEFPRGALPELNTALEFDIIVGEGPHARNVQPGAGILVRTTRAWMPLLPRLRQRLRRSKVRSPGSLGTAKADSWPPSWLHALH